MINYTKDSQYKGWEIIEEKYINDALGKTEAIMTLGNGYLGLRSSNEEKSVFKTRNMFINGVFNRADLNEVTELANIADIIELDIKINGKSLIITEDTINEYSKTLNIKNATLERKIELMFNGIKISIKTLRFVSFDFKHLVGQKYSICTNKACDIEIRSGIDAQVSNSGAQHFFEGEKRLFDDIMHCESKTTTSNILVSVDSHINFDRDVESLIQIERRKIYYRYRTKLESNNELTMYKINTVCSSFDREFNGDDFTKYALDVHNTIYYQSFSQLLKKHIEKVNEYWSENDIIVRGNDYVQLAIRFAMYSLRANTNISDERTNIGAKGLTGEGYKGHTFWDTEIFMLPYFIYTNPFAAKNLLKYRYLGLEGARKKATENGYEGAMYPWESANPSEGEVTPIWGAADIITGLPTKIMSGFIEQHITADVTYGVWLYYQLTNDYMFMQEYGFEIILDTAKFWTSRVEERNNRYEITNVVGPDEYKEEVDNNAFTNIMAKWNIDLAIEYINKFDLEYLINKLDIDVKVLNDVSKKLYTPTLNSDGILPQNDTYLNLKQIDLSKYKNQEHVGLLFEDYNLETVNKIQVTKQADVMLLFLLLEDMYDYDAKVSNFNFYESRTLHDSSLSLSTHVVLASDLKLYDLAKELFEKSLNIDLGQNLKTSDHGIHTASQGGFWQSIVYGLGGIRFHNNILRVEPNFFNICDSIEFSIYYRNQKLSFETDKNQFTIFNQGSESVTFKTNDVIHTVCANESIQIEYNNQKL